MHGEYVIEEPIPARHTAGLFHVWLRRGLDRVARVSGSTPAAALDAARRELNRIMDEDELAEAAVKPDAVLEA